MRYMIRYILFVAFAVLFMQSCADAREASSIADVYDAATERVLSAVSSEELVEISYALHLELADYDSDGKPGCSRAVSAARERFKKAVWEKEVGFYATSKTKK